MAKRTFMSYEESFGGHQQRSMDFYNHPEKYVVKPFRIFGNLYYVGDKKVCSHLIDTGDGLILIDTGYQHSQHLLIESIYSLGFDPRDIKIIIHSHGHFDHLGAGDFMRAVYGSRIYMSRADTESLQKYPQRALMDICPCPLAVICMPDEVIDDGQVITLGNTSIRCVLTPGHTVGTMSFFFDVTDGQRTLRAANLGGVGLLTMHKGYCRRDGLPENMAEVMLRSIQKIIDEPADIVLGNHPFQNKTLEKRRQMIENPGTNPFIDPAEWRSFLLELDDQVRDFIEQGY